jgi:hypothetical protein
MDCAIRKDHFARGERLRCAIIESKKSLCVSSYVISTVGLCQTIGINSMISKPRALRVLCGDNVLLCASVSLW